MDETASSAGALERCGLFAGVPAEMMRALGAACRTRHFAPHTQICACGEVPRSLFLVLSGGISYVNTSPSGQETVIGFGGVGTVVGLACFTDGRPMHSDVRSLATTSVLVIPFPEVERIVSSVPQVWRTIARFAFQRMRMLVEMRVAIDQSSLSARISWHLLSHAPHLGGARGNHLPLSQDHVAKLVGASRARVNRALRRMEQDGLIGLGYRSIDLRDPDGLLGLVQGSVMSLVEKS